MGKVAHRLTLLTSLLRQSSHHSRSTSVAHPNTNSWVVLSW